MKKQTEKQKLSAAERIVAAAKKARVEKFQRKLEALVKEMGVEINCFSIFLGPDQTQQRVPAFFQVVALDKPRGPKER
jgi:hypothetical protein